MDDKRKKGSLRGRGREIMRGISGKGAEQNQPKDKPFFEDEDALLNWMGVAHDQADALEMEEGEALPDPASPETAMATLFAAQSSAEEQEGLVLEADDIGDLLEDEDSLPEIEFSLEESNLAGEAAVLRSLPPVEEDDFEAPEMVDEGEFADEIDLFADESSDSAPEGLDLEEDMQAAPERSIPPVEERVFAVSSIGEEPDEVEPEQEVADQALIPDGLDDVGSPRGDRRSTLRHIKELVQKIKEEGIPQLERMENVTPIDLSKERLNRGALAGLIPQAPERLPSGQLPMSAYESEIEEDGLGPALDEEMISELEEALDPEEDTAIYRGAESVDEVAEAFVEPVFEEEDEDFPELASEEAEAESHAESDEEAGGMAAGLEPQMETYPPQTVPVTRSLPAINDDSSKLAVIEERRPAAEIFRPSAQTPDTHLLSLLVDDSRMQELFNQIEGLQEELILHVRGQRGKLDIYQEELLQASNLLLQSRENYDEARAIVYRVRADLNRERRVEEDIEHYRPLLINIYIGLCIALMTLLLLGQLFTSLAENVGVSWLGQGYYPALFGAIGSLLYGYLTLNRHTAILRDFDPIHVSWYLINPFIGMLMGFLMYLIFIFTILPSVSINVSEVAEINPVVRVDILLAFIAGYNQNTVITALDSVRQRFTPGSTDSDR